MYTILINGRDSGLQFGDYQVALAIAKDIAREGNHVKVWLPYRQ